MKRLIVDNMSAGSLIKPVPVGKYSEFLVIFTGAEASSQTMLAADLGEVRLRVGSDVRQTVKVSEIQPIENLFGGVYDLRADSTVAGVSQSFHFAALLRQHLPGDQNNVLEVLSPQDVIIEWQSAGTFTTTFGSGNMYVYGIENKLGEQAYILEQKRYEQTLPAGTPTFDFPGVKNPAYVFIENDTDLTRFQLEIDGAVVADAEREAAVANTNRLYMNETFSGTLSFILGYEAQSRKLNEIIGNSLKGTFTVGTAETFTFVVWQLHYTPNRMRVSQASAQAFNDQKVAIASQSTPAALEVINAKA